VEINDSGPVQQRPGKHCCSLPDQVTWGTADSEYLDLALVVKEILCILARAQNQEGL
jgi:hypothetical protein